jgi:hypothetical protein
VCVERHYSYYSKVRHNFCTYKVEIEDVDNSNTSKLLYSITYSIIIYCNIALRYYVGALVEFTSLLSKVAYLLVNYVILK